MSHVKGHGRAFIILDRLLLVIIYPRTGIMNWSHIHTLFCKHALLILQSNCSIIVELDLSLDWFITHMLLAQCKASPCPSRHIWALFNPQVIHSIWWLPVWQQQYKLWLLDVKPFQSWKNSWKCFSVSSETVRKADVKHPQRRRQNLTDIYSFFLIYCQELLKVIEHWSLTW